MGARQKKFAWKIGIALASVMFALVMVVNSYSPISGLICFTCLIFLFFESAFGICLGCKFYPLFFKEKAEYCPGEVCTVHPKHEIQIISRAKLLIVLSFFVFIVLTIVLFKDNFRVPPFDLFGFDTPA